MNAVRLIIPNPATVLSTSCLRSSGYMPRYHTTMIHNRTLLANSYPLQLFKQCSALHKIVNTIHSENRGKREKDSAFQFSTHFSHVSHVNHPPLYMEILNE